jgi:hypothetical protein
VRRRGSIALRWAFLVAVVVGAWWSWRNSGPELSSAVRSIGTARTLMATIIVLAGLALTGAVWTTSLRSFGVIGSPRTSVASFFVAQLGKYVPGSIWSFAAQGVLATNQGVSARTSVAAAVLFLGAHTATGLLLVGVVGWWTLLPRWIALLSLAVGVIGLAPATYRFLGPRLAGADCRWDVRRSVAGALLMTPVWSAYGGALLVLSPPPDLARGLTVACAFVLAFAGGVLVPVAPAGLGAREGVLVALLAPVLGIGPAGALAIMARLVHTVADFVAAGVSWLVLRSSASGRGSGATQADH